MTTNALDLVDAIIASMKANADDFDLLYDGTRVAGYAHAETAPYMHLRLIAPHRDAEPLIPIAGLAVEMLFSELTNNDACDITVRVRSAHLDDHDDLPDDVRNSDFATYVVIDADVLDYLT